MADNERKKKQNDQDRAKQIEEKIAHGPEEERGCTDILCCIIFVAFMIFMCYVGVDGFANGDPSKLVAVYDSSWLPCGKETQGEDGTTYDLTDYKYVYFAIPYPGYLDKTTCVKECPSLDGEEGEEQNPDDVYPDGIDCNLYNQTQKFDGDAFDDNKCKNDCFDWDDAAISSIGIDGLDKKETFCIYSTQKFLGRVCVPGQEVYKKVTDLAEGIASVVNMEKVTQYLDDIDQGKGIICASVGIAFVLGLIYMCFVRVFSGIIVWLVIILYFAITAVLTYFVYSKYKDTKDYLNEHDGEEYGDNTESNKDFYFVLFIILCSILGLSLLGLICLFNDIRLAVAIIKTATIFIVQVPSSLLVPIIMAVVLAGWWILWSFCFIYVYSVGDIYKRSDGSIFAKVKWEEQQEYFVWLFVFGGLWVNAFLQSLTQFVLASTCSIWYWDQPDSQPHRPVLRSFYRAFRYHLGSLAFGSFILAFVQIVRLILEYLYRQSQKSGATQNKTVKYIFTCLRCCLACFERFIKFLNKIAYVQIALSGDNFCKSARLGMSLVFDNKARVILVNGLGAAFIFVGKIFMISANVLICYLIYTKVNPYKTEMTSIWPPLIIILVLSWGISTVFLSVYSMSIDTVLLCFLYDEKINASNPQAKLKAPETLAQFFAEHNSQVDKNNQKIQQQK